MMEPIPHFDAKRHMRRVYIFCAVMCVIYFSSIAAIVWATNSGHEATMVEVVVWVGRVTLVFGLGLMVYLAVKLWGMTR